MHLGRNDTSESRSSLHNLEKDVHGGKEGKVGSQRSWAMQGVPGRVAVS